MNLVVEKSEQYALLTVRQNALDADISAQIEKSIAGMYSGEGKINFIINLDEVKDIADKGHQLFGKVQKICVNESGLLVLITKNIDLMDQILSQTDESLLILPTNEEGVDAVFMNELENDFKDERDDEFGQENESDY